MKAHVLIKADEDVPRFVCLTEGKENDNIFPSKLTLPKGSIVTFDRIYYGFKPLANWSKSGVIWVTRMHSLVAYTVRKNRKVSQDQGEAGIISDEIILAGTPKRKDKLPARRITYKDPVSGKELIFLTNNTRMKAITIAEIYKKRWQIECLFKRLKQNYPLKYFLGDNENAIKVQIWCALIADLLIKVIKDKLRRKWSFSNIAGMIRLHLMTYIHLTKFLEEPERSFASYGSPEGDYQLSLFPT